MARLLLMIIIFSCCMFFFKEVLDFQWLSFPLALFTTWAALADGSPD